MMGASGCSALLPWLKGTLGCEGAPRVAVGEEALMSFGTSTVIPSAAAAQPSSSIIVGPLPLNYQQQRCYLAAPHLLGAPHDAVASSLAVATLAAATASNCAPCRYTSLLPPLHLLTATSTHCSSPGCRNNRYPSLSPPSLATTTAPPSPTSFSTYW
ncbi:hypothetical protein GW17_00018880 [Ensete ventricosum]|nr:hypothetical protein GW17_00018880 [Ensete ventricosum]